MILEQKFCCTSASNALRYYYFLSQHYGFTMEKHKNAKHNSLKLFIHAIRTERERERVLGLFKICYDGYKNGKLCPY